MGGKKGFPLLSVMAIKLPDPNNAEQSGWIQMDGGRKCSIGCTLNKRGGVGLHFSASTVSCTLLLSSS